MFVKHADIPKQNAQVLNAQEARLLQAKLARVAELNRLSVEKQIKDAADTQ